MTDYDLDLNTRLCVPTQVMSRIVGDETVLLDLASGLYFGLDGVGKLAWESVSSGKSLAETAEIIATEYDVAESQAQSDLLEFTSDLVERGLLEAS